MEGYIPVYRKLGSFYGKTTRNKEFGSNALQPLLRDPRRITEDLGWDLLCTTLVALPVRRIPVRRQGLMNGVSARRIDHAPERMAGRMRLGEPSITRERVVSQDLLHRS
ncbi:hypothetical protein Droror1_Dr00022821 [Drosera rotundifolia]